MTDHTHNPGPSSDAPDSLIRDLRALHQPPSFVTAALDDAVLRRAISKPPFRFRRALKIAAPLAAAAAIAFLLLPNPFVTRAQFDPADIDRDGQITILDAFALARAIDAGTATNPAWDRNADGRITTLDADAIALAAVSLDNFGTRNWGGGGGGS